MAGAALAAHGCFSFSSIPSLWGRWQGAYPLYLSEFCVTDCCSAPTLSAYCFEVEIGSRATFHKTKHITVWKDCIDFTLLSTCLWCIHSPHEAAEERQWRKLSETQAQSMPLVAEMHHRAGKGHTKIIIITPSSKMESVDQGWNMAPGPQPKKLGGSKWVSYGYQTPSWASLRKWCGVSSFAGASSQAGPCRTRTVATANTKPFIIPAIQKTFRACSVLSVRLLDLTVSLCHEPRKQIPCQKHPEAMV